MARYIVRQITIPTPHNMENLVGMAEVIDLVSSDDPPIPIEVKLESVSLDSSIREIVDGVITSMEKQKLEE